MFTELMALYFKAKATKIRRQSVGLFLHDDQAITTKELS